MAQYRTLTAGQTQEYDNGYKFYRIRESSGVLYVDKKLTSIGFAGTENVDWKYIDGFSSPTGLTVFRYGVRDTAFVIDQTLTATGFAGTENTDWENLHTYNT